MTRKRFREKKGHYNKRCSLKYSAGIKNTKDRATYQIIISKLHRDEPMKKIVEETGVLQDNMYKKFKKMMQKE